jgi:hypothetical protein
MSLRREDSLIRGDHDLILHATSFYKNLCGVEDKINVVSLDLLIPCVMSEYHKVVLIQTSSLEEIKIVVFQAK